jgi:hypothetical protein
MKNTKIVTGAAASGYAAMPGGANRRTFSPEMATRTKFPKKLPNGREREDESADRRGTALWWSVFTFVMEGFATYAAAMYPSAAFSVEAVLIAARRPHPWSAGRTPRSAERERGPYLISEHGNVVGPERVATIPVGQVAGIGSDLNKKTPRES